MKRYILLLAICLIPFDVHAASLFGKVIEVNSGAFGDVAKKHLADPPPSMELAAPGLTSGNWRWLRPAGASFSALVPEDGKLTSVPVPDGESNVFVGRDGWSVYAVTWIAAPTMGETDKDAISQTLGVFLKAVGQGFRMRSESVGRPQSFVCELQNEKSISQSGYTGSEYELSSCTVPARARAFTRVVDDQRQMYMAVVFYMEEDENVTRFIKSFTVATGQKSKSRTR